MFDIFVGCMLRVASTAIAGILFSPTVSGLSSVLRHEKTLALIIGSFCIVICIGKDALVIVQYHISWTATVLKTQLVLSACSANLPELTHLKTL